MYYIWNKFLISDEKYGSKNLNLYIIHYVLWYITYCMGFNIFVLYHYVFLRDICVNQPFITLSNTWDKSTYKQDILFLLWGLSGVCQGGEHVIDQSLSPAGEEQRESEENSPSKPRPQWSQFPYCVSTFKGVLHYPSIGPSLGTTFVKHGPLRTSQLQIRACSVTFHPSFSVVSCDRTCEAHFLLKYVIVENTTFLQNKDILLLHITQALNSNIISIEAPFILTKAIVFCLTTSLYH